MTAGITRTKTLTTSCNRQDLYDLIGTAGLNNISATDLQGVFPFRSTQSSPPATLVSTEWWYDQTDQLLKIPVTMVDGSPASFYLAIGPDRWDYPGFNITSLTIPKGTLVRWSYSPAAGIYDVTFLEPVSTQVTHPNYLKYWFQLRNFCGIAAQTIPAKQFGPIVMEGFVHVAMNWSTADKYFGSIWNTAAFPLVPSTQYTGYAEVPLNVLPELRCDVFAYGFARPETTGVSYLCPAFCTFPVGRTQRNKP